MNPLIESLGWTLIHFLWQASIIAALLWICFLLIRSARARCFLSGGSLVAMLVCAAVTAEREWQPTAPQENVSTYQPAPVIVSNPSSATVKTTPAISPPLAPEETPKPSEVAPVVTPVESSQSPKSGIGFRAYLPWVVALWAIGVVGLSLRFLRSWLALRRVRSGATPITEDRTSAAFARLLERMGLRRPVALLSTAEAVVPMVVGCLRPAVILPAALLANLPAWQVEAILAHELAHVRRHDFLVNLLQNVVETIFFYHPAVWWVSGQLRREREHCCDDAAAATCGNTMDYARALTALEEMRGHVPATALSAASGSLLGRIRRLLGVPDRDPRSVFSWPLGLAVTLLVAGLFVSTHFVQAAEGDGNDRLPDAPPHNLAKVLVERWQNLEEKESPLPESRVAGIRTAIAKYIDENSIKGDQYETLTRYKNWHADQVEHSADDVTRLLKAIAATSSIPLQIALRYEIQVGKVLPKEELDRLNFGPATPNGLRAAWSFNIAKPNYVFGDVVFGSLIILNSGTEEQMIGSSTPDVPPPVTFTARGEDGRVLSIERAKDAHGPKSYRWRLKPGEVANYSGYRLKIGPGERREQGGVLGLISPSPPNYELAGLRSGEEVSLSVAFSGAPAVPSGVYKLTATAPADMKVWSTNRNGTWQMAGGVSLELRGEIFHGADVMTTGILTWPDGRTAKISVAADFNANRGPWAVAWEADKSVLWIAVGEPAMRRDQPKPLRASNLKRVDFSDPDRIELIYLNGWPEKNSPSAECRAAMDELMIVKIGGKANGATIQWANKNPLQLVGNALIISVRIAKDGRTFHIDEVAQFGINPPKPESQPLANLEKALRAEAANVMDQWELRKKTMSAQELQILGVAENARPTVQIYASAKVTDSVIVKAIAACEAAGVGSEVSRGESESNKGASVRGVELDGVAQIDNVTKIPELYEADPDSLGDVRQKEGVFFMSLGEVGPWLYYAKGADHFYLKVRPDPEVVKDIVYGPIIGSPVDRLDLKGWLKESPEHPDPGYARRVARDMIKCGDESLARLAFDWFGELPPPSPPGANGWMITAIKSHLENAPESTLADEARVTLAKLEAMAGKARVSWDALREQLPEDRYGSGEKIGAKHAGIIWSKETTNGLRLGVAGITADESWKFGDSKDITVYVRNDGAEPVKFAWTPRMDEGLSAGLTGSDGTEWQASIIRRSGYIIRNRCRLDPNRILELKSASFDLVRLKEDGTRPAGESKLCSFALTESGSYKLQLHVSLGVPDWTDSKGTPHPRPAGEWAGVLESASIPVSIMGSEPEADSAAAGRRGADERTITPSEVWPEAKLAKLPFGPPAENGLRVARFLSPVEASYQIGSKVDARIVFHNTGKESIEFTTADWHQNDTWHCRDQDGEVVKPFDRQSDGLPWLSHVQARAWRGLRSRGSRHRDRHCPV